MNDLAVIPGEDEGPGHELGTSAVSAQAMATVQARYLLALRRPRNIEQVRHDLLRECRRPAFADKATYRKPMGGGAIEGPSIRFVEAAMRAFRNIDQDVSILWDSETSRNVRVAVTDLESNITYRRDIVIAKQVERRRVRPGQHVISERVNSSGQKTFLVSASDDELLNKEAAMVSKAIRQLGLRVLPGDLVEEALGVCAETRVADVKEDPEEARKRIADAFVSLGVEPADLAQYLGHAIGKSSPKEIAELRELYEAMRSGEITWAEIIDDRKPEEEPEKKSKGSKAQALTAKLTERKASQA